MNPLRPILACTALLAVTLVAPAAPPARGGTNHWAFQPVRRPAIPTTADSPADPAAVHPIDAFVRQRLTAEGREPAPETDRSTLIRRVALDLTGLPPSPAEVDAFLTDSAPDAFERLVNRLLASPHYGERWGRWWLDAARYADSNGYSIDSVRSIWPYRDWVVAALNRDLPFDQFTVWQLAGDLLPEPTPDQVIATGFHRNTQVNHEGGIDPEQFRIESAVDRVNATTTVWLGLTLACAQCHDHKYDPFSQRDYYRLFAFFNQQENDGHGSAALEAENTFELGTPAEREEVAAQRATLRRLETELKDWVETELRPRQAAWELTLDPDVRAKLKPEALAALAVPPADRNEFQQGTIFAAFRDRSPVYQARRKPVEEARRQQRRLTTTLVMKERPEPRETFVMVKGDFTRRGETVTAGVPALLERPAGKGGSGRPATNRLDLARWLVDPANPLTARVTINRLWQVYFGKGLVETENDFGTMGTPPSHPELLDWLASEFVASGWSLKAIHRLIVTSATYRQSSHARPALDARDPANRLLGRQTRLRLEAELIRDTHLAISGLLDARIGGPPVFPPQPAGIDAFTQNKREWKPSTGGDRHRRALYTHLQRTTLHPALSVFDAPDTYVSCTRRLRSNTPLQALTLLNDQAFLELARGFATRLQAHPGDDSSRIEFGFRCCLARPPAPEEQKRLVQLFNAEQQAGRDAPTSWLTVARVLLNLDETITRE